MKNIAVDEEMSQVCNQFFSIIPGIENAAPVAVLQAESLTRDEFNEKWVSMNKPCLIKGAVKHWPAVNRWKEKGYWLGACDNFKVNVYPHQNFNSDEFQNNNREEMLFHDAIERLFDNKDHILSLPSEPIPNGTRFNRIMTDIGGFNFLDSSINPRLYSKRRFFIYRRAATAWHYHDADETLMCQVNGNKRVALLPPKLQKSAYVTDFLQKEKHLRGEALDPALKLSTYVTDVQEGDALYIPPYWHHGVVPTDGEVGFTLAYCWASPIHILGDFSNYFVRSLFIKGIWPIRTISFALPFIALFAGVSNITRKIKTKLGLLPKN